MTDAREAAARTFAANTFAGGEAALEHLTDEQRDIFYKATHAAIDAYLSTAVPTDVEAVAKRLEKRANDDQSCADNSQVIVDALAPQMELFEARQGHNVYAVRMAVDHASAVKRDTQYAQNLRAAATLIRAQAAQLAEAKQNEASEEHWQDEATYEVGGVPHLWRVRAEAAEARLEAAGLDWYCGAVMPGSFSPVPSWQDLKDRLEAAEAESARLRAAASKVVADYDACSGAEPSLSVLHRSIDTDLRAALNGGKDG